jgi:hypothetical protein
LIGKETTYIAMGKRIEEEEEVNVKVNLETF